MFANGGDIGSGLKQPKRVVKTLLRNLIRQTDTHNRIVEEEECWRQHGALKAAESSSYTSTDNRTQCKLDFAVHSGSKSTAHYSSQQKQLHRAHMDDVEETLPRVYNDRYGEEHVKSNFWLRQLDAAESSDPNRWGHSGYKTLYPEEFERRSSTSDSSECHTKCSQSGQKPKRKKLKHKDKKHKKKSKKHKRKKSCDQSSPEHRTEGKSKKRKRRHEDHVKKKKRKKSVDC